MFAILAFAFAASAASYSLNFRAARSMRMTIVRDVF